MVTRPGEPTIVASAGAIQNVVDDGAADDAGEGAELNADGVDGAG